jgi:TFIIF-interacting CTD phosphatase-like protein
LNLLDRDLSKTIIIDNLEENFRLTPENGIAVPDFIDDFKDNWLHILKDFLIKVAENEVSDVRPVLEQYRNHFEDYQ